MCYSGKAGKLENVLSGVGGDMGGLTVSPIDAMFAWCR